MGRFQKLRGSKRSIRGIIAACGAVLVAASMAQTTGTLADPVETRTATMGVATQNYFPTPLTAWVTCTTDPNNWDLASRRARIDWAPVAGATGYILELVQWNSNNPDTAVRQTFNVGANQTQVSGIVDRQREQLYARVRTVNGPAISSGYTTPRERISFKAWIGSQTECENTGHSSVPNQPWENQNTWSLGSNLTASTPGASIFAALFDEDASRDVLGELPEGDALTTLDEVALDEAPTPSMVESTVPSSTRPGPSTSARESAPSATPQSSSAQATSDVATTKSSTSQATRSSSPTVTSLLPEPSPTQAETSPSSSVPTPATTTTTPSVKARVGDSPIPVGESFARLEDIDGRTHLVVTRGGTEVCSANVDGASRIEEVNGELTVTVAGRTSTVDIGTCELT